MKIPVVITRSVDLDAILINLPVSSLLAVLDLEASVIYKRWGWLIGIYGVIRSNCFINQNLT